MLRDKGELLTRLNKEADWITHPLLQQKKYGIFINGVRVTTRSGKESFKSIVSCKANLRETFTRILREYDKDVANEVYKEFVNNRVVFKEVTDGS